MTTASNDSAAAVFLDRDGTLMREVNYCSDPKQVEIFPGVPEALLRLKSGRLQAHRHLEPGRHRARLFHRSAISPGRSGSGARGSSRHLRRSLFLSRSAGPRDRSAQTCAGHDLRSATRSWHRSCPLVFRRRQGDRHRMWAQRRRADDPRQDRLRCERNAGRTPTGSRTIFAAAADIILAQAEASPVSGLALDEQRAVASANASRFARAVISLPEHRQSRCPPKRL